MEEEEEEARGPRPGIRNWSAPELPKWEGEGPIGAAESAADTVPTPT